MKLNLVKQSSTYTSVCVGAFAACVLLFLPLYMPNGFIGLIGAKSNLFILLTVLCLAACIVTCIVDIRKRHTLSLAQIKSRIDFSFFTLPALVCVYIVSTVLANDKLTAIFGLSSRHNGIITLITCLVCYVLVRLFASQRHVSLLMSIFLLGAVVVCSIAWANLFYFDPLDSYYTFAGTLDDTVFLSTIGNINFLGGYLCIVWPVACFAYLRAAKGRNSAMLGALTLFITATFIPAGTDGAWVALAAMLAVLPFIRNIPARCFARLLVLFGGTAFIGGSIWALQLISPLRRIPSGISAMLCTPYAFVLAAILFISAFIILRIHRSCTKLMRTLALVSIAGIVLLTILVNIGYMGNSALAKALRFAPTWGTNRASLWQKLWYMYIHSFTPAQKIFGLGGDSVNSLLNPLYTPYFVKLNGSTFDSAHNEFLQHLICGGAAGLMCFIGFWASHIVVAVRKHSLLVLSLTAYAVQSFFSIANPSLSPLIFVLAAICTLPCDR